MTEQPAFSADSEHAVLATMLQAPGSIAEVRLQLREEDFYRPANATTYAWMVKLHEQGKTVDPVLLATEMTAAGIAGRINAHGLIAELAGDLSVVRANIGFHANRVRELSRVRRMSQVFQRGLQAVQDVERGYWRDEPTAKRAGGQAVDLDRLQSTVAKVLLEGELLVDEKLEDMAIAGLSTYTEFLASPDSAEDWLVPDLIEKQDIWMWLAAEGGGKSWLSRQIVLCLGAGIHPFHWNRHITPVRSLLIDLENADSMIRRQSRGIQHNALMAGDHQALNENTYIWRHQAGLNVRNREDALLLEAVIDRVRPQFVALGSLYNSFHRGGDDWETAAEDVKQVFNRLRARYGFAWSFEHHMPKGDGIDRPKTPYGSSVWQRWVTHGRVMNRLGPNLWALEAFRGDRDQREIPAGLERGGQFPWAPIWGQADMDARLELEIDTRPKRRRA